MPAGVLVDTSYLITLAGKSRKHHDTARRYWRHFLENQIPIFLSTIVVSEFCIKQELPRRYCAAALYFHSTGKRLCGPPSSTGSGSGLPTRRATR